MGGGVINYDYESEELLSLYESSLSNEHCNDSSDGETPLLLRLTIVLRGADTQSLG